MGSIPAQAELWRGHGHRAGRDSVGSFSTSARVFVLTCKYLAFYAGRAWAYLTASSHLWCRRCSGSSFCLNCGPSARVSTNSPTSATEHGVICGHVHHENYEKRQIKLSSDLRLALKSTIAASFYQPDSTLTRLLFFRLCNQNFVETNFNHHALTQPPGLVILRLFWKSARSILRIPHKCCINKIRA